MIDINIIIEQIKMLSYDDIDKLAKELTSSNKQVAQELSFDLNRHICDINLDIDDTEKMDI